MSAPFAGTILKVHVLPGAYVSRNEELIRVKPIQVGSQATALRAISSGYVTELNSAVGQIFEPTDTLLTVSDLEVVLFEGDLFDLSEADHLRNSNECSVHTKRLPTKHFSCKVETVDAVFRGAPPVGHVHASIRNSDTELKPGMTGEIHLALDKPRLVLTVPKEAILGRFEKQFVYLKDSNSYTKTPIQTGEPYGDSIQVLSGISAGDNVVIQGHYQLQFASSDTSKKANSNGDHGHDHTNKGHNHSPTEEHSHNGHKH